MPPSPGIGAARLAESLGGGLDIAVGGGADGVAAARGSGAGAVAAAVLDDGVAAEAVPALDGIDALLAGAGAVAVFAALRFIHGGDEHP